jgi:cbb3-type cytochrome oxidase subunit 3
MIFDISIGVIRGVLTAILFAAFIALWIHTWSKHRTADFEAAARLPFEESDETGGARAPVSAKPLTANR